MTGVGVVSEDGGDEGSSDDVSFAVVVVVGGA